MASYKGSASVNARIYGERDEIGAWTTVYEYQGIQSAMIALANSFTVPGPKVTYETIQGTALARVSVQFGNNQGVDGAFDRWEVDRENIDKDIMLSPLAASLTDADRSKFKDWKTGISGSSTIPTDFSTAMQQLASLVLRGVESFEVSTLVLKRSRRMSAVYASVIDLTEKTTFYSTAALIARLGIPSLVASRLPTSGPAIPSDCNWGWLPRLDNRSYIGRGEVEEQNDWVFAGRTTLLYTYGG